MLSIYDALIRNERRKNIEVIFAKAKKMNEWIVRVTQEVVVSKGWANVLWEHSADNRAKEISKSM